MIAATVLAIILIFGMGGGPFGDLVSKYTEDPIKTTIVDVDRRELALKELDSLQDTIEDFNKEVLNDIKQFDKLVKNYESTPEDFNNSSSSILVRHRQDLGNLWTKRSAMLKHIQADEWQTIIASAKAEMEKESD